MGHETLRIGSPSFGDPARYPTLAHLERDLAARPGAPREAGRLVLIVRRCEGGLRETPDRTRLATDTGLAGDAWSRRKDRLTDAQISVMQREVAELIANGQP